MNGWLVNDCLTCIPGTKTFWHDLLENVPGLVDKTNTYTDFNVLAETIEKEAEISAPSYLIRNATFFRKLNITCKQISILQDIYAGGLRNWQIDVCNNCDITVFNSQYTYENYKDEIKGEIKIIPLGVDFNLFKSQKPRNLNVLPHSILYVGSSLEHPKGFSSILDLINNTSYNFCLTMKDNFTIDHPRVKVFNMVNHEMLVDIYNSCEMLICSSIVETQHLVSIEGGACDLPIITTNVGALYNIPSGAWGVKVKNNNFVECIEYVLNNKTKFSPRNYLISRGFDKETCMKSWKTLINSI
jgi:glycosyltransferase involved in cell wall biosynthesis